MINKQFGVSETADSRVVFWAISSFLVGVLTTLVAVGPVLAPAIEQAGGFYKAFNLM